jgi:hypothetical protein
MADLSFLPRKILSASSVKYSLSLLSICPRYFLSVSLIIIPQLYSIRINLTENWEVFIFLFLLWKETSNRFAPAITHKRASHYILSKITNDGESNISNFNFCDKELIWLCTICEPNNVIQYARCVYSVESDVITV